MSIENNLKRIADALEKIAEGKITGMQADTAVLEAAQTTAPTGGMGQPDAASTQPAQGMGAPVATLSAEDCNAQLIEQHKRLGGTAEAGEKIKAVIAGRALASMTDAERIALVEQAKGLV